MLFLFGTAFFSPLLVRPAEARDIYVRLAASPPKIALSSDGTMTLTDSAGKKHSLKKSAALTRSGASAAVGKKRYSLPARISSPGLLRYNGRKYRGTFLLTRSFVLINVLDVEDYVRGVVPAEAGSDRPKEYLKVQAIISRTYGLRQSLTRASRGFDVTDTTSDQVYKGAGAETPLTDQAVRETAGEVLTHENALALAPFHSDSGGHTAASSHVWTEDIPYLRGVREAVAYRSPNANWTARLTAAQVQAALKKMGCDVGQVRTIRVAKADSAGRAVALAFTGSRGTASVKASGFRIAAGPNLLKSTMLGAPSAPSGKPAQTPFPTDITAKTPTDILPKTPPAARNRTPDRTPSKTPAKAPVPVSDTPLSKIEETLLTQMITDGVFSPEELVDMLKNLNKKRGYLYIGRQKKAEAQAPVTQAPVKAQAPVKTRAPLNISALLKMPAAPAPAESAWTGRTSSGQEIPVENGVFVFRGRGWGHGVGLSQWGAMAMAGQGWTAGRILEHYYPGTAVKRFQ
ncbi:MAG: SpoIID/LytB domain-containing protein [Synergistaceae bacterium]|jgi:stage II sporulation protein D|nr:SpoIID/LytB domain-containing protein [Synergistaceae bacterium]